jgi:hypothetical protein
MQAAGAMGRSSMPNIMVARPARPRTPYPLAMRNNAR